MMQPGVNTWAFVGKAGPDTIRNLYRLCSRKIVIFVGKTRPRSKSGSFLQSRHRCFVICFPLPSLALSKEA